MLCPNCGYNNQPNNRFCVRCGIDIAAPPAPDTPSFDGRPRRPSPRRAPPPAAAGRRPPPPNRAAHRRPAARPPPPPARPASAAAVRARRAPPPTPPSAPPPPQPRPPNPFAPPAAVRPARAYPPPRAPTGSTRRRTRRPATGTAVDERARRSPSLVLGLVGWIACGIGSIVADRPRLRRPEPDPGLPGPPGRRRPGPGRDHPRLRRDRADRPVRRHRADRRSSTAAGSDATAARPDRLPPQEPRPIRR